MLYQSYPLTNRLHFLFQRLDREEDRREREEMTDAVFGSRPKTAPGPGTHPTYIPILLFQRRLYRRRIPIMFISFSLSGYLKKMIFMFKPYMGMHTQELKKPNIFENLRFNMATLIDEDEEKVCESNWSQSVIYASFFISHR